MAALLASSLVLLLVHSWGYRFLTDDAFISFRYARNLADGHGLVFNPGHERVEGYTNFLWVLILAAFHRIGVPIEHAANPLSLIATVGLWALVVRETLRRPPGPGRAWLVLVPALALAVTRSVAVWSTSGLETRLFELLVVAAAFRMAREVESLLAGETPRPWAAVLFGLAEWTRPDGLLLALGAFGAALGFLVTRRRFAPRRWVTWVAPCVVLIAAHFAFRLAYYGDFLPNTYYAKVDGRFWWDAGGRYLAAFALEYGVYLWIPLIVAGVARLAAEGAAFQPLLVGAMLGPHLVYVAAIGGDHFEYRPLDLIFPFAFLLLYHGARAVPRSRPATLALAGGLAIVGIGLWQIPFQSRLQMPGHYCSGFPGGAQNTVAGREFLSPHRDPILRLPGIRAIAERHRQLVVRATYHFSAIRQEEHKLFLESLRPAAHALRRLVDSGRVPRDFHIALPCVGVIPYDSDLRTLDRIGLTDAHVAHSPFIQRLRIAHDKSATDDYLRSRNVDLLAEVRPVCDVTSEDFLMPLRESLQKRPPYYAAVAAPGLFLIGRPLDGPEHLARRIPGLRFEPMDDSLFFERYVTEAIGVYRARLQRDPGDDTARQQLALLLGGRSRYDEAIVLLEEALTRDPGNPRLWLRMGWCQARLGRASDAERNIVRAIEVARASGNLEVAQRAEALLAVVRKAERTPDGDDLARPLRSSIAAGHVRPRDRPRRLSLRGSGLPARLQRAMARFPRTTALPRRVVSATRARRPVPRSPD